MQIDDVKKAVREKYGRAARQALGHARQRDPAGAPQSVPIAAARARTRGPHRAARRARIAVAA